ncbi:MAG: helix-turn-helix domain-containing protein [Actinobacteria bacterium]|nr:helix-turn-helix domain-containing protein [Actinomycetota bacterium]
MSAADLARRVQVDPKTVNNWINRGSTPRRETQREVANTLGCPINEIWPDQAPPINYALSEIVNAWSHRSETPKDQWLTLLKGATQHIDLLGTDVQLLLEDHSAAVSLLNRKAGAGCRVRIILPSDEMRREQDRELRDQFMKNVLSLSSPGRSRGHNFMDILIEPPMPELRYLRSRVSYSMSRFDDDILLSVSLFNQLGRLAPVLQLHSEREEGIFALCVDGFDELFSNAVEVE